MARRKVVKKRRRSGKVAAERVTQVPKPANVDSKPEPLGYEQMLEQKRKEYFELESQKRDIVREPVQVTAVLPVKDAFVTLGRVLMRLAPGAQSVPMNVILVDNESEDPSRDVLSGDVGSALVPWMKGMGFQDVRVLGRVIARTRTKDGEPLTAYDIKNKNIEHLTKKLTMEVKTKYTLYVDADVEAPVDCVRQMVEVMEAREKMGLIGVLYDWVTDHVKLGCTLARTALMRDIDFSSEKGCPCRTMTVEAKRRGYETAHLTPQTIIRPGYGPVRMVGTHLRYNWR